MVDRDAKQSILLVGGPNTGKTHYGGQLLGRLQAEKGALRFRRAPTSIEPLKEALHRLGQGRAAGHTSVDTYSELSLPVEMPNGLEVDLVWPDYGGEQVKRMMQERRVEDHWQERIRDSAAWLLFIRPTLIRPQDDVFSRPFREITRRDERDDRSRWSQPAWYTELVQLFLYVRRVGTLRPIRDPRLAVVLSCWDELDQESASEMPGQLLAEKMPMFSDFLLSTWDDRAAAVFGVSSLGRSLSEDDSDEDFLDFGPESFGYTVTQSGKKQDDLSVPIQWLLSGI